MSVKGNESQEISPEGRVEKFLGEAREHLESVRELSEMDFFEISDRYGFEQVVGEEEWSNLSGDEEAQFLKGVGEMLGVDLVNIREEEVVRREFQEGVKGEKTEKGADVTVLRTKDEMFEVHVMNYKNPDLGTRYDIVRAK